MVPSSWLLVRSKWGHPRRGSCDGNAVPRGHGESLCPVQGAPRPAQLVLESQQGGAVRHQAGPGAGDPGHGHASRGTGRRLGGAGDGPAQDQQDTRAEQKARPPAGTRTAGRAAGAAGRRAGPRPERGERGRGNGRPANF